MPLALLDAFVNAALEQAPVLAVTLGATLWIVRAFLTHIDHAADQRERLDQLRAKSLSHLGDECHAVQREATAVMSAIRVTLEANQRVIQDSADVLRQNADAFRALSETHQQLQQALGNITPACPLEGEHH